MFEEPFYFDFKRKSYTDVEIRERADWYQEKAREGMEVAENSKSEARNILYLLNKQLKFEMKEYDKLNFKRIEKSNLAKQYTRAISEAYTKQSKRSSYENVTSNLYDIQDYMGLWKPGYGNIISKD